ncbi:HDOD domain-containing protein [Nitrincola sp.]|uniref:HDOD domain-containing protein n=1 Tax=Nitrincola sp. TaxID=1926584 RepID=UPI003A94CA0F
MASSNIDTQVLFCDLRDEKGAATLPLRAEQSKVFSIDEAFQILSLPESEYHVIVIKTHSHVKESIELLRKVRKMRPGIGRILITHPMKPFEAGHAAEVAHRCLSLEYTERALHEAVDRAIKAEQFLTQPELRDYISSLGHLPSFPAILVDLDEALRSETSGVKEIADIVQRDPGIVTKILQLVNSAYFGLSSHNFFTVKEAVNLLGLRTIRDLVLTAHLFESMPQTAQWRGFSFDQLQERSVVVSQLASDICRDSGYDRNMQAQARLAGLLLDVGMILLAMGDGQQYHQVMIRAQELNQPLYVVEKMLLGATHAQAGAFLLDRWNLAPEMVHAVLFHHVPGASGDTAFSALTAVHLADSLLPPLFNAMGCNLGGRLSREYLTSIGVIDQLPKWEMAAHEVAQAMRS